MNHASPAIEIKCPHQTCKPAQNSPADSQIYVPECAFIVVSPNIGEDGREEIDVQYRYKVEDIYPVEHR